MTQRTYNFKLPKKLTFEEIANEFVAGYDQISDETKQHTLQIYAAYNCNGTPYYYGNGDPYCEVGENS